MQGQRPPGFIQDFGGQPQPVGGPIEIELPAEDVATMADGAQITPTADGGVEIDLQPQQVAPQITVEQFDANLAMIDGVELDALASEVVEAIEQDIESRQEWSQALADGIKLLGITKEKMTKPFPNACGVWDPMMAESVIRFWATFHGEMLPPKGPCKTDIVGVLDEMRRMEAQRVQDWMNYYLTQVAKEWIPAMDQLGFWLPLAGSMFKKVYQCPIKSRPVAPFIMPQDFIVPYTAADLETAPRTTIVNHMSRRDVRLRQIRGIWKDFPLIEPSPPQSGQDKVKDSVDRAQGTTPTTTWRGDEQFDVYEVDLDIDLTQFGVFKNKVEGRAEVEGLPLPYRLVIDKETRKPFALHRNWRQGDPSFSKRRQVVHYKFLPGLGFYGFGYAHVLGSLSTTGTAVRRQIIDACTLSMFPGGLRAKGMKFDNNNKLIGPSEFPEVDTGGQPINQAITLIPRPELSQIPILMLKENNESARTIASNVEIAVGEGRQDAPVGTTVALLEGATRISSASLQLCHIALGDELQLMADIFGRVLPNESYPFPVPGGHQSIMREDFSENTLVRPVSDPKFVTSTQRIIRAEAKLRLAMQAPQIHDLRAAYRDIYIAMGDDEESINRYLPPPAQAQPLDPLSENQIAITGGPLKAFQWQDHEAHIKSHELLAEVPAMSAHIAEHMALKMRSDVERILGSPLPPMGTPLPPEIEAQIAVMVAKAIDVLKKERGQEITPDQIIQEELRQEWAKIANAAEKARQDAMVKSYAARMKFQQAERDRESRERMEILKAAANTADNKTPPVQYVRDVLDIALKDKSQGESS